MSQLKTAQLIRRFLIPGWVTTLCYFLKFKSMVSPRAEVELSPMLKLGVRSSIGSFSKVRASDGPLHVGERTQISTGCEINAGTAGLFIGDNCMISACVSIIGNNYRYDRLDVPICDQEKTSKGITIGNNVWVGSGARILDGSTIGAGVIVTPNSVVSGKVQDNVIIQGNPAKVIFRRR